jgi:hypothetical protein
VPKERLGPGHRRGTREFLHALAVAGGAAEDLVDAVAGQDRGDADRDGELHLGVAEIERMAGDAAGDALGRVERAVRVEMVEQQGEGAAAIARGNIAGADQALQQPRDVTQCGIAGDAAMALIDRPPIVDIDRDQGCGDPVAGSLADDALQLGPEVARIGQRGERIAAGLLLGLAKLGARVGERRAKQRILVVQPLQRLARVQRVRIAFGAVFVSPCHAATLDREG